jgi:hypothetical protein
MIHYHGTPVGGDRLDPARFLRGRHALIPFADSRDLGIALEVCQSVVLDNSAFTYWKRGGRVDVAAYHAWVHTVAGHPSLDWCLIPDIIDGTEQENVDLVTLWLRMGSRVRSVPVWHLHESLDWLEYLVTHFQTVALGSSGQWSTPGTEAWWNRMAEAMAVACDSEGRPRTKLHGLRMLNPEVFTRLPLASADSVNASLNSRTLSRFGMYPPPTLAQRSEVIAERIEAHNSAPRWCGRGAQADLWGEMPRNPLP